MIEVSNLTKSYGRVHAVKGLSFKIPSGEIVGLLGPNGAGKTTTMRMLTTFIPPTSGTASVCGYDILKQAQEVRSCIGYLPETPPLYSEMRVSDYLKFVASIKGVPGRKIAGMVAEAIERAGLGDVRQRVCGELSKGYKQRVGLAQAIVHKPKVIILDEPTSGLDPAQIIEIRALIRSLQAEHSVVISTHILPEVSEVCSRVIIISHGMVSLEGELADLTQNKTLEQRFLEAIAAA